MLSKLLRLLRKHRGAVEPAFQSDLAALEADLRSVLASKTTELKAAFDTLGRSTLPAETARLHLEVIDEDEISIRAFAVGADGREASLAQRRAELERTFTPDFDPDEPMDVINAALDASAPLIPYGVVQPYFLWMDDPNYGRAVAEEQPADRIDRAALLRPWLNEVTAGFHSQSPLPVTWALHDVMEDETLR